MSKKPKKPKEDDNLEPVRAALDAFNVEAAIGTYHQIDAAIEKLKDTRTLPPHPHQRIRRQIYQAGITALSWKHHKLVAHPRNEAATSAFFDNLQMIVELNTAIQSFDDEQLFSVTHREPDQSDDLRPLDIDTTIQRIEDDVQAIRESLSQAAAVIENFKRLTYIPKFIKDGNRKILFTHHFIEHFAAHWAIVFGQAFTENDLPDMTRLIATALVDLRYPLSRSQQHSDDWLSDRIRKQIFKNSAPSV